MVKCGAEEGTSAAPSVAVVVEELPRTIVRRIVKDKLSQISSSSRKKVKSGEGGADDMMLHKDALLAFAESTRVFIHYLSATANDICKESKRQTVNAEDVFKALDDMEFPEFIQPLRASLEEFRTKNAGKRMGIKARCNNKKRNLEEELPARDVDDGGAVEEDRVDEDAFEEND
ncbi:hypothetical protein HPP92_002827 [Vanilla planifolia]|uniref:Transcription factor CBF/NF-Y/archaeal histone domain-containing protein n=1 Tax=Vanilla planifolia TaxID=51239 RepID=A0A835S1C5_VANPL|nr:hypothetical protein HPP92_003216 [Vanilla planifolia]KAG0502755.1 hypothetical protein HPP92_002827 [Vanilla planifolia]